MCFKNLPIDIDDEGRMTLRDEATRAFAVSTVPESAGPKPLSEAAIRDVHTIKGVAGNVGAEELRSLLQELEANMKANKEVDVEPALEAWTRIADNLKPWLDSLTTEEAVDGPILDDGDYDRTVARLRSLLKEDDTESEDVARLLVPSLKARGKENEARELIVALEAYDFEGAARILGELDPPS